MLQYQQYNCDPSESSHLIQVEYQCIDLIEGIKSLDSRVPLLLLSQLQDLECFALMSMLSMLDNMPSPLQVKE